VWKYNFFLHMWTEHAQNGSIPAIPPETLVASFVFSQEEADLGITREATQIWREKSTVVPDSDVIVELTEKLASQNLKRRRTNTVSSVAAGAPPRSRVRTGTDQAIVESESEND
jgi:hypothetical protein